MAASNAAASATPYVPISAKTTSDGLARFAVCFSSSATENTRNGTSNRAANAKIAGSSAFKSTDAMTAIAA